MAEELLSCERPTNPNAIAKNGPTSQHELSFVPRWPTLIVRRKLRSCKDTQSSESYSCGEVPDRTETSSGRRRSPKRLPVAVSIEAVQRRLDEHPEKMRQRRDIFICIVLCFSDARQL